MKAMNPADELAMVRTRIAQLQARECELREALIGSDPPGRVGRWTQARVIEHRVRHFDHRLLPFELQADPLFWRENVETDIALALRDGAGPRPRTARETPGLAEGVVARGGAIEGPGLSAADVAALLHSRLH